MPDVLSQDEITRLLKNTGKKDDRQGSVPIITYDFRHPTQVSKDQQRTLENLHSNLARILAAAFSVKQRSVVDVEIAFVDQTTYAEFIMSLSNPSCSYTFSIEPLGGPAIMDYSLPVAHSFIDRTFGGRGKSPPRAQPLTRIERSVMGEVVTQALADLEATWEPLLKIQVSDAELETNPEFMQIAVPSDTVVLIAFEFNSQHASGLINLCYPYFTLEPVMSYLNIQAWSSRGAGGRQEEFRQKRLDRLKSINADVRVVWGRGEVAAEDLAGLRAGDTIVLETRADDPAVVFVQDQPLFLAQPGASPKSQYAVELVRSIPPPEGRRYV